MRNPFKIFVCFGILCIVVIYIIFGPYMLVKRIGEVIECHQDAKCVIEIPATVTYVEDSADSEGGTNYYIYVAYNYEGKDYSNIYWRMTNREDDSPVGTNVTISISENNPDKIFEGPSHYYSLVFIHLIITGLGLFAAIATYLSIHNPDFGNKKAQKQN